MAPVTEARSRNTFLAALIATLAFRLWLAAVMPMTGDEAYFIWWGKVPDWGFYDHPHGRLVAGGAAHGVGR